MVKAKEFKPHYLLVFTMVVNTTLVYQALSWPIVAIFVLSLLLNLPVVSNQVSISNKVLANTLSLVGIVVLLIFGRQIGLLNSMICLLVLAYGLKLFEQQNWRERNIMLLLSLFILASSMIFKQTLAYGLVYFSVLWLNLVNFVSQYHGNQINKAANKSALILLQSLPLAIALFVIFPRLNAFWKTPNAQVSTVGLSEELSVGDIANLALSNELAFRVTFDGEAPKYQDLYWRTIVMESFDGTTWRSSSKVEEEKSLALRQWLFKEPLYQGVPWRYQVIAEPSFQSWLFALDIAQISSNEIQLQFDYSIKRDKPLTQKFSYDVESYPMTLQSQVASAGERNINTYLPKASNPRLKALANQIKEQGNSAETTIENLLHRFREQEYFYTLSPPALGSSNTSLDEFFFDSKQGFCMHYAASFTYLMRAMGIPSRVVTGYLGGELHSSGEFYSIYQRDAHAWSEVWLDGKGWMRIDPTAAVNPERVESGFSERLSDEQHRLSGSLFSYGLVNSELANWLRSRAEFFDYQWSKWVVGYSANKQFKLLNALFKDKLDWLLPLSLFVVFALSSALISVLFWWRAKKQKLSSNLSELKILLAYLAKKECIKQPDETVNIFLQRVSAQYPNAKELLENLVQCYQAYMFKELSENQKHSHKQRAKKLSQLIIKQINKQPKVV